MATDAEGALSNLIISESIDAGVTTPNTTKTTDNYIAPSVLPNAAAGRSRKTRRRRGGASDGDIVIAMMTIRDQIKLYHWQTRMFARHKATDDLIVKLDTNIDMFVETYMGKYGRPRVSKQIKLTNFSESAALSFVERQRAFLSKVLPRKISAGDTDLLNIRDTILADLNQVLYLFTLN
jgi:hypothetical protein